MTSVSKIRELLVVIKSMVAPGVYSRVSCGDCERNAQCGLPPHKDCVFRLMQISRDGDRRSRSYEYLYPAVWPKHRRTYEIGRW